MTRLSRVAAPLALLAPLTLAACAEAPPPAPASPEPPPPGFSAASSREPSPVDAEMLAIGHAEEEIDRLFAEQKPAPGPRRAAEPPPPPPPPAPPSGGTAPSTAAKKDSARPSASLSLDVADACSVACKALASMVSSADHLCKLSGENDGRCDDARSRVRGAMARVKSSCPSCSVSPSAPATAPAAPKSAPPPGPAPGMPGSSTTIP